METEKVWIAPNATLIGEIEIGKGSGVFYQSVIRTEEEPITIGENTNIQDGCILHTDHGYPISIGNGVTIGHRALIHGATIGDDVLVGMGAIVMNGACLEKDCMVAAGALVPEGRRVKSGTLVAGVPAREIRSLTEEEVQSIRDNARHYALQVEQLLQDQAN